MAAVEESGSSWPGWVAATAVWVIAAPLVVWISAALVNGAVEDTQVIDVVACLVLLLLTPIAAFLAWRSVAGPPAARSLRAGMVAVVGCVAVLILNLVWAAMIA